MTVLLLASVAVASPLAEGHSVWEGTYWCSQGLTHLVLDLEREGNALSGRFDFGPHPPNPDIPAGSFRMHGTVDGSRVTLLPGAWIARPDRYLTVGLTGDIDSETDTLSGDVTLTKNPDSCRTFTVQRVDSGEVATNDSADCTLVEAPGTWNGIGVEPMPDHLLVVRVAPDAPAAAAGISPHATITHLDGQAVEGMAADVLRGFAVGVAGSTVRVQGRLENGEPFDVALRRTRCPGG